MRFSQGTTASLIASTATMTVVFTLSHTGAAATTTHSAADAPPFQLQQQQQQQEFADTGILSPLSRHLTRSHRRAPAATHHNHRLEDNKTAEGTVASSLSYSAHRDHDGGSSSRELQGSWCPQGYVTCKDGLVDGSSTTCATACLDGSSTALCCSDLDACSGFTGKVCKDGTSCMGSSACMSANIPQVKNSCQGSQACHKIATTTDPLAGVVGNIINSCNGVKACYALAAAGGKVGNIQNSCIGESACEITGVDGGIVGDITSSCTAQIACAGAGLYGGKVGNIVNSCTAYKSCDFIGAAGGLAGNIQDSCTANTACSAVGGFGGSIGSIISSCNNAVNACADAGKEPTYAIVSNLNNCCNVDPFCQTMSESTLPAECLATDSPTSAPTTPKPSTTISITKTPTKSPVFVTLSFVGGCPAQISSNAVTTGLYEPGDRVSKGTIVFECKSWPNSLFCSQAAFNPPDNLDSKSTDWKQAWDVIGHCTGTLTPPTAGCPDVWTSGDMTKYKENDQVSVIKSSSPLIQVVYKCKAWPYSWYCGQLSPLNYNGGKLGWEIVGECSGTMGPTTSPTFDPLTAMIDGCPQEYNLAAIKNYMAGDKVSVAVEDSTLYKNVFVCREFPYSGYCSQSGFAPGEQYDYMAWTLLGPCEGTLAPTSAPSLYSGGALCTYTKVVTTTPTPTPVVTPVGTWTAGTLYEAGDQVRIGAKKFQCKPWPFYLWCRMSAYKPTFSETGLWTEAWTVAGTCPAVV